MPWRPTGRGPREGTHQVVDGSEWSQVPRHQEPLRPIALIRIMDFHQQADNTHVRVRRPGAGSPGVGGGASASRSNGDRSSPAGLSFADDHYRGMGRAMSAPRTVVCCRFLRCGSRGAPPSSSGAGRLDLLFRDLSPTARPRGSVCPRPGALLRHGFVLVLVLEPEPGSGCEGLEMHRFWGQARVDQPGTDRAHEVHWAAHVGVRVCRQ